MKYLFLPCTGAQLTEFINLESYIDYVRLGLDIT